MGLSSIASHAYPEMYSSIFSGELTSVVSVSPAGSDEKSPVRTMNRRRRAIGWNRGIPEYSWDLEVAIGKEGLEADFEKLRDTGEEFVMVFEADDGGHRVRYERVVVHSVTRNWSESGEARATISMGALEEFLET